MITIISSYTFNSLITATLLKLLLRSSHTEIVQEAGVNSSQLSLNTKNYHLEYILHEYERKYGQITLLHKAPTLWQELESKIEALCLGQNTLLPLETMCTLMEEIITDEEPFFKAKNLIRQLEQTAQPVKEQDHIAKIS